MIDIHNHVLIGVDDGPKNEREAVQLLEQAIAQGITDIIATPHHHSGSWKNPAEVVNHKIEELKSIVSAHNLDVNIHPGQEIRISGELFKELKSKDSISLNHSQYILIEFPFGDVPLYAERFFFDLQMEGYIPLIAHPERCNPMLRKPEKLYEFIQKGALSQITASSITGGHGDSVRRKSLQFIENNLAHVIASDAHSTKFRPFDLQQAYEEITRELGEDYTEQLKENAIHILYNKDIQHEEPIRIRMETGNNQSKSKKKKFLGLF